jgi:16S rRNA (cytosine967-C5)-methyltransferase
MAELVPLQAAILEAAAAVVRPGGTLTYSTCTISAAENELQIEAFLAAHPGWEADDLQAIYPLWKHPRVAHHLQTLPHRDGTDGFFIARLRRPER